MLFCRDVRCSIHARLILPIVGVATGLREDEPSGNKDFIDIVAFHAIILSRRMYFTLGEGNHYAISVYEHHHYHIELTLVVSQSADDKG